LELQRGTEVIGTCDRMVGIRRFGVRGRWLSFEGKRFVLRGIAGPHAAPGCKLQIETEAAYLRESWTAVMASNPDDQLCAFASRSGVLLVASLTWLGGDTEAALLRLSQWPAVGIALLASDAKLSMSTANRHRNLLLAQFVEDDEILSIHPWAQLLFARVDGPADFASKFSQSQLPVVAVQAVPSSASFALLRSGCDMLQQALAPYGDFAGYLV